MTTSLWCDRIIGVGFFLLFSLVPLILTPWNYELFEFNKMLLVYGLTTVIVGAWIVKMVRQGQLRITRTPFDIPISLFVVSQFVSSLFSIDPHVSWFGYYSRFNGGMLSIVSYVLLYYAFVSNVHGAISDKQEVISKTNTHNFSLFTFYFSLLKVAVATGMVVALYGVAERLGVDKHLWVQDVQNRVFSTLGQPNWLAAYLVALAPIAMALGLQSQMSKLKVQNNVKAQSSKRFGNLGFGFDLSFGFWIWILTAALFFVVLLFTRSRSGLLGFVVADVVFLGLLLWVSFKRSRQLFLPFVICQIAFGMIVFFNGTHISSVDRWITLRAWKDTWNNKTVAAEVATPSGTLLEIGGTESGTIRNYVWQGAVNAWRSSLKTIAIGTGTETFAFAFFQFRPKGHNLTSEWDFLYNKAHNEYLNYLATTGVLGLGSYLLLLGSFVFWFVKTQMPKVKAQINAKGQSSNGSLDFEIDLAFDIWILKIALFSGWLSILITNFFGFSVVVTQLLFYLFPAFALVLQQANKGKTAHYSYPVAKTFAPSLMLGAGAAAVFVLVRLGMTWYADTQFAEGYRLARADRFDAARTPLTKAAILSPNEPLYRDELASTLASLSVLALERKDASTGAQLAKDALAQSDTALAISPKNVNFWKTRTKLYYQLSSFDPKMNQTAIEALTQAQKLSPNDPKIAYNLAILYGRSGDNRKAIELLTAARDLKPNYRDVYWALYVFYNEVREPTRGTDVLQEYLTKVDPGDKEFLERLKQ